MTYCLRSFIQILEEVLYPDQHHKKWVLDHDNIPEIKSLKSLWKTASFLRDFLDDSSPLIQHKIADLEDQIMDAAEKAEDTLETYLTFELVSNLEGQAFTIFPPYLGEAIQAFEDAKQKVIKIRDACQQPDDNILLPVSTTRYPNHNNVVVGVKKDLNQLRSRLTSQESKLDIIPIVGMGGMGKTTLATILYDEFSLTSKSHFDCSAWVTVSQIYDLTLILRTLLASVTGKHLDEISHKQTTSELIVTLHKTLFRRRYLIVLDDIWSSKAWDDMQSAFPRDNKGSRIILTTREKTVGDYVNPKCHEMHLINEDESWELLRGKVFGEESCPPELEEVGKKIARSCRGLPLALQVIGGLLSQPPKSVDFWEHVAYNVSSLIVETDYHFSGIFSLSFAHLPHYLKPCFLYMAGFREDNAIPASIIIKMWMAEGFLYPVRDTSLEEAARIHLNALVDRNLIFVRERGKSGRAKTFGIHDLLRDLCLKKAQEKNFMYFKDLQPDNIQKEYGVSRIVRVAASKRSPILTPLTRSFRSYNKSDFTFLACLCSKSSLLRMLDFKFGPTLHKFPGVILQLVNLRYLQIRTRDHTPAGISFLRNLQTLIIDTIPYLAMILSEMPQLRDLKFLHMEEECSELPPYGVHKNLQSLSRIPDKEVKKLHGKLPNLRKLKIDCCKNEEFIDLTCFCNLESLDCYIGRSLSHNMSFPVSLKKLRLMFCVVDQSLLDAIGTLPNLQILIIHNSWDIMDWEPREDGFRALKYLEIEDWNLVNWLAADVHFPVLKHLVLKDCDHLIEIPDEFGDIDTLDIIKVDECLPSVFESARRIYKEQCKFGNTNLQLRLYNESEEETEDDETEEEEEDDETEEE